MSYDHYPSRGTQQARLIARQEPVVYATDRAVAPIDPHWIAQYNDQGFIVLNDIFSAEEVSGFQQEIDRLRNDQIVQTTNEAIIEPHSRDLRSVFCIHEISPVFEQLASDRRLAGLAQYLLDDRVYIHQSRLNYKPGFRGQAFYWHSDFETWHVEDGMPAMRALSISVTLTDNYAHNGSLMLIPGSHRQYVVCEGETPQEHFKSSLKKQEYGIPSDACLAQLAKTGGITTVTGKPGSVIVFDCNTMHGSNSNITPFARSNAFFVYNAMSNRVIEPFGQQPPRPEYICTRERITPINSSE